MSRRRAAVRRSVLPDAKYNSVLVAKFINILMRDGKKSIAESIFYHAIEKMANNLKEDPLEIFQQVIDNVRPSVEVCSRRLGGATYQIPREISDYRAVSLAAKWLAIAANKRKNSEIRRKLYEEMLDAYNNRGMAIKMKEEIHKLAEANKAFAHFRW